MSLNQDTSGLSSAIYYTILSALTRLAPMREGWWPNREREEDGKDEDDEMDGGDDEDDGDNGDNEMDSKDGGMGWEDDGSLRGQCPPD